MSTKNFPSVDAGEIEKFSNLATQWWDATGPFAPLHALNPIRLQYIRDVAAEHFGRDPRGRLPFSGLSLLDLGCGGGLLSEPLSRIGFQVLGCDASDSNIRAAALHAGQSPGLSLTYRTASAEEIAVDKATFDIVLNMEVVEHVADVSSFLSTVASLVRPGGLLFTATINKTLKSLALAKIAAEYLLRWLPAGTHDWNRFVAPKDLEQKLSDAGLQSYRQQGISFDPLKWNWHLSSDTDVNYVVVAKRRLARAG